MTTPYLYSLLICAIFLVTLFLISRIVSTRRITSLTFLSWKKIKKKEGHRWLQIVDRQYIGKNTCLLVVKTEENHLLLGVTEHNIAVLQEMTPKNKHKKIA